MDLLQEAIGPIAFRGGGGSTSEFLRKHIATFDFPWGFWIPVPPLDPPCTFIVYVSYPRCHWLLCSANVAFTYHNPIYSVKV